MGVTDKSNLHSRPPALTIAWLDGSPFIGRSYHISYKHNWYIIRAGFNTGGVYLRFHGTAKLAYNFYKVNATLLFETTFLTMKYGVY